MLAQTQYKILWKYLQLMLEQKDWHGVRDAVVDIEVLIAKNPDINAMDTL